MGKVKSPREVRRAAGRSMMVVAVACGVSEPTIRLYENGGAAAVTDERKRAAIVREYDRMARAAS